MYLESSYDKTFSRPEKEAANAASLQFLQRSVQLDSRDHLAFYHLALQYMRMAKLNEAMEATRGCLAARAGCAGGLRLVAALWGAAGAALASAKELLTLLNSPEHENEPDCNGYAELDAMSDSQPWEDTQSNKDGTSMVAESVATCCVERVLAQPAPPRHAQRAHAWLALADLCLRSAQARPRVGGGGLRGGGGRTHALHAPRLPQ
ncbi:hypothetical protein ACJJTC_007326, partial [Scirpophaga incertulas]